MSAQDLEREKSNVKTWERYHLQTIEEYAKGYHAGVHWASEDRNNHIPTAEEIERLQEEAQSSQRWARAFYLGALRGYRSVARTLKAGRWGL